MAGSGIRLFLLICIQLQWIAMISEGRRASIHGISHRKNPSDGRCHSQSSPYASGKLLCGQGSTSNHGWLKKLHSGYRRYHSFPGEFPFTALVETSHQEMFDACGGVLIDDQHILTAAHCLKISCNNRRGRLSYIEPAEIRVILGEYSREKKEGGIIMNVSHAIAHQDYLCKGQDDIALLRLTEPVSFNITANHFGSVNDVCLSKDMPEVGERALVLGYLKDLRKPAGGQPARLTWDLSVLHLAELDSTDDSNCENQYGEQFDKEKQICLADTHWIFPPNCLNGRGEPVVYDHGDRYHLLGLVTEYMKKMDRPCLSKSKFFFYTRVSYYLDWIAEKKKFIHSLISEPDYTELAVGLYS